MMKKKCLLVLLVLFSFGVLAQLPKGYNLKETIIEGSMVLIEKKSKVGVYSLKKQSFLLGPSKAFFYYVERNNCLFVADPKAGISAYNVYQGTESLIKIAQDPISLVFGYNNDLNHFVHKRQHYRFQRGLWETVDHHINEDRFSLDELERIHSYEKMGLKLNGNLVDVYDYKREGDEYIVPLIDSFGEDSIAMVDGNWEAIYPPRDPAITRSGVWNNKKREWLIRPKHQEVYKVNDFYIALDGAFNNNDTALIFYDLFKIDKEKIVKSYPRISRNAQIPFSEILKRKVIDVVGDSIYSIYSSKGKQGLTLFYLFYEYDPGGYFFSSRPHFTYYECLPPEYDLILPAGGENEFYLEKENSFNFFLAGENFFLNKTWDKNFYVSLDEYGAMTYFLDGKAFLKDSLKLVDPKKQWFEIVLKEDSKMNQNIEDVSVLGKRNGLVKINDSLSYIHFWEAEYDMGFPLISMEGYDSVDYYGEVVYSLPDPGVYKSGVYNRNTNKWIVDPKYASVVMGKTGFTLYKPVLNEYMNLDLVNSEKGFVFDFMNIDGSFEFKDMPESTFNGKYKRLMVPDYDAVDLYRDRVLKQHHYYFIGTDGIGLFNENSSKVVLPPKDYLKVVNDQLDHLSIENDSVILYSDQGRNAFSLDSQFVLKFYAGIESSYRFPSVKYTADNQNWVLFGGQPSEKSKDGIRNYESGYQAHFEIQSWHNNLVYINDYSLENNLGIAMTNSWGGDSIDENYENVWEIEPAEDRSGLFNHKTKKWIVPLRYKSIQQVGETFFAKRLEKDMLFLDVYNSNGDIVTSLENQDLSGLNYRQDIFNANEKLFWFSEEGVTITNRNQSKYISFHNFDQIKVVDQYSSNSSMAKLTSRFYQIHGNDTLLAKPNILNEENWISSEKSHDVATSKFEINKLNDSLLYILNYIDDFTPEYPFVDEFGYDSIDVNGFVVYPETEEGVYKSGVFNYRQMKWIGIHDARRIIIFGEDKYAEYKKIGNPMKYQKLDSNWNKVGDEMILTELSAEIQQVIAELD